MENYNQRTSFKGYETEQVKRPEKVIPAYIIFNGNVERLSGSDNGSRISRLLQIVNGEMPK